MKIKPNPKSRQSGIVLWVLILVVVIFILIIAGIATVMIRTLMKLVPPEKKDDGSLYYPGMGQSYGGGHVIGYMPGPSTFAYQPGPVPGQYSLWISADDSPLTNLNTNCIFATNWPDVDSMTNALSNLTLSNLTVLDPDSAGAKARYYHFTYATP